MAKPPRKGTEAVGAARRRRPAGRRPRAACRREAAATGGRRAAGQPRGDSKRGPRGSAGLGGEQVEGRQAVRELLLAGRRKVREIWLLAEQDPAADPRRHRRAGRGRAGARPRGGPRRSSSPRPAARRPRACWPWRRRSRRSPRRPRHGTARAAPPPFLVAVDGVTDPGNLGALLRSAECAGATGVVLPRHRAVHVTPDGHEGRGRRRRAPAVRGRRRPARRAPAAARSTACGWSASTATATDRAVGRCPAADGPIALVLGAEGAGCRASCASAATSS